MNITEEKLVSILIQDSIIYHAKIYGVEGVEQKINELYCNMPKLKNKMLTEFKRLKGV